MTTGSILWFLAIAAFFYFMMRNGGGCCPHGHSGHGRHEPESDAKHGDRGDFTDSHHLMQDEGYKDTNLASTWKDPVCGMEVQEKSAALTSEYQGRTFYFCSEQCRKMFDLYPNKYI